MTTQTVKQLINGEFVESTTSEWIDLTNPATQQVIAKVPQTTSDEINQAVAAAAEAGDRAPGDDAGEAGDEPVHRRGLDDPRARAGPGAGAGAR